MTPKLILVLDEVRNLQYSFALEHTGYQVATVLAPSSWWGDPVMPFITESSPYLPEMVGNHTPRPSNGTGKDFLYDASMTRVFLANAESDQRQALRELLQSLKMKIVGESIDWSTTLAMAPKTRLDMLLIDWSMFPTNTGDLSRTQLRQAFPNAIVVVLISHLDVRHQAAISAGADAFISKGEIPERMTERLQAAAESVRA